MEIRLFFDIFPVSDSESGIERPAEARVRLRRWDGAAGRGRSGPPLMILRFGGGRFGSRTIPGQTQDF